MNDPNLIARYVVFVPVDECPNCIARAGELARVDKGPEHGRMRLPLRADQGSRELTLDLADAANGLGVPIHGRDKVILPVAPGHVVPRQHLVRIETALGLEHERMTCAIRSVAKHARHAPQRIPVYAIRADLFK